MKKNILIVAIITLTMAFVACGAKSGTQEIVENGNNTNNINSEEVDVYKTLIEKIQNNSIVEITITNGTTGKTAIFDKEEDIIKIIDLIKLEKYECENHEDRSGQSYVIRVFKGSYSYPDNIENTVAVFSILDSETIDFNNTFVKSTEIKELFEFVDTLETN